MFVIAVAHQLSSCSNSQSSTQRVGALSLIPACLGISGHPSGSPQGHPLYTGAHEIRQHSTQCRNNTPNMVAEQRRSRARALSVARRSTRTTTTNAEMLTISVCTYAERAERASTVKCRILRRISTEVRCLARRREPTRATEEVRV